MEEMLRADNITFSHTDDQHRAVDGCLFAARKARRICGRVSVNGAANPRWLGILTPSCCRWRGTVYVEDMSTADERQAVRHPPEGGHGVPRTRITRSGVATVVEEDVAFALENLVSPLRKCGRVWTRPCRWPDL